jgi:hypothetical protein
MPEVWIAIALAVAGSAIVATLRATSEHHNVRKQLRAKRAIDPSLPDGTEVRVTGFVRALDETLAAPFSAYPCVVFRSRMVTAAGLIGLGVRPKEAARCVRFAIELPDGSRVTIDSTHARLDLPAIKLPAGSEKRCLEFAMAHAVASGDRNGAQYEEVLVQEGMAVSVCGLLMKDIVEVPPSNEREFRQPPPPALRIAGNAKHPIAIGAPVND